MVYSATDSLYSTYTASLVGGLTKDFTDTLTFTSFPQSPNRRFTFQFHIIPIPKMECAYLKSKVSQCPCQYLQPLPSWLPVLLPQIVSTVIVSHSFCNERRLAYSQSQSVWVWWDANGIHGSTIQHWRIVQEFATFDFT